MNMLEKSEGKREDVGNKNCNCPDCVPPDGDIVGVDYSNFISGTWLGRTNFGYELLIAKLVDRSTLLWDVRTGFTDKSHVILIDMAKETHLEVGDMVPVAIQFKQLKAPSGISINPERILDEVEEAEILQEWATRDKARKAFKIKEKYNGKGQTQD